MIIIILHDFTRPQRHDLSQDCLLRAARLTLATIGSPAGRLSALGHSGLPPVGIYFAPNPKKICAQRAGGRPSHRNRQGTIARKVYTNTTTAVIIAVVVSYGANWFTQNHFSSRVLRRLASVCALLSAK